MKILKEFVSYNLALKLKELGFDEPCFGCYIENHDTTIFNKTPKNYNDINYVRTWRNSPYDDVCSMPLKSQVFNWFKEKYNLTFEHQFNDGQIHLYVDEITYPDGLCEFYKAIEVEYGKYNEAYQKAEIEVIKKMIQIVNN